jgi:hypothetical protein
MLVNVWRLIMFVAVILIMGTLGKLLFRFEEVEHRVTTLESVFLKHLKNKGVIVDDIPQGHWAWGSDGSFNKE